MLVFVENPLFDLRRATIVLATFLLNSAKKACAYLILGLKELRGVGLCTAGPSYLCKSNSTPSSFLDF